jgi:N-acetylmuramoyl-L-alanine amidase
MAFTVCIDPGHSRATVGASGRKAIEYRVAWQIALRLKQFLEQKQIRVVLTKRTAEENVSNERRAAIANRAGADLSLRLHADAGPECAARNALFCAPVRNAPERFIPL